MKKHIRFILTVCLALCMVLCMGLAVACQNNSGSDDKNTFTITILNEDGTPAANQWVQYCSDGAGAQCYPYQTNSNGKVTVDVSTDEWKNSENIHVQVFNLESGYSVYDENDNVCSYDPIQELYEVYVDHHTVNSVTLTIKKDPIAIDVGYEYDVRDFAWGESKKYSTVVFAGEAIFDADLHGGEFDLSVVVNSNVTITETLNANKTSVVLNLGVAGTYGNSVLFTLTPKNADSTHATFSVSAVQELGSIVNIYNTDVYKVYFNIPDLYTELVFSNPFFGSISDVIDGFPITLTIGNSAPIVWESANDVSPISLQETGHLLFTFEFGDVDTSSIILLVENANASSDDTLVVGQPIDIDLSDEYEGKEFTYISDSEEAETYYFTITGSTDAKIQFIVNGSIYSEWLYASENDGIIEYEFPAGAEVTIIFGTDKTGGDSYSVLVSKKGR